MVVKHVGLGKETGGEREREREQRAPPRERAGARRASLLVYGLQGAFRFFTLAHFESDDQRKT